MTIAEGHYLDGLGTFAPLRGVSLERTQRLLTRYIEFERTRPGTGAAVQYARARLKRLEIGREKIVERGPRCA